MNNKNNYEELNAILCVVYIRVTYHTEPNQTLKIVGSIPQLGCWDPNKGLELGTTQESYPGWIMQGSLMLQKGILKLEMILLSKKFSNFWCLTKRSYYFR